MVISHCQDFVENVGQVWRLQDVKTARAVLGLRLDVGVGTQVAILNPIRGLANPNLEDLVKQVRELSPQPCPGHGRPVGNGPGDGIGQGTLLGRHNTCLPGKSRKDFSVIIIFSMSSPYACRGSFTWALALANTTSPISLMESM